MPFSFLKIQVPEIMKHANKPGAQRAGAVLSAPTGGPAGQRGPRVRNRWWVSAQTTHQSHGKSSGKSRPHPLQLNRTLQGGVPAHPAPPTPLSATKFEKTQKKR